jgi:hypothetical protein
MLFELNSPFCWSNDKIGNFGSIDTAIGCVASVVIIQLFHCFTTDQVIALFGCIMSGISYLARNSINKFNIISTLYHGDQF